MSQVQIAIPVEVRPEELARKQSFGSAIEYCAELNGISLDKSTRAELEKRGLNVDKAQFSRWKDGSEGIKWPKLVQVMDAFGNDAPVLWMLHQRKWDLHSLRRQESDLERENRELKEEVARMRKEREIEMRTIREIRA